MKKRRAEELRIQGLHQLFQAALYLALAAVLVIYVVVQMRRMFRNSAQ